MASPQQGVSGQKSDCIIWLDGSEGLVRAMDIVKASVGKEAVVRALLKAIENPHNPAKPGRPKKIVVKDRELQFLLRGVLQNLDIEVDWSPQLPLLDELWLNFQNSQSQCCAYISPELFNRLGELASSLWPLQPWLLLSEDEILRVDINRWHVDSLYVSVLGMMGEERGIVLYRTLDSLKHFRQRIAHLALERYSLPQQEEDDDELESIFLQQDCWFVNYNPSQEEQTSTVWRSDYHGEEVSIVFGSIHPYEGIRPIKEDEEIFPIYVALSALASFIEQHEDDLAEETIRLIREKYPIQSPEDDNSTCWVSVSTMPDLTRELEQILDDVQQDCKQALGEEEEEGGKNIALQEDLIPEDTIVLLETIPSFLLSRLHNNSYTDTNCPSSLSAQTLAWIHNLAAKTDFPVIILQTTKPKARQLLCRLEAEKGIVKVIFANGGASDHETLGVLQTTIGNFYVFAQFPEQVSYPLGRWQKRVAKFDGYCGVVVAMGAKGSSRGNPQPKDFLYLFYTRVEK